MPERNTFRSREQTHRRMQTQSSEQFSFVTASVARYHRTCDFMLHQHVCRVGAITTTTSSCFSRNDRTKKHTHTHTQTPSSLNCVTSCHCLPTPALSLIFFWGLLCAGCSCEWVCDTAECVMYIYFFWLRT